MLRCLGATSGQVLLIYGLQAGMMGLAGAAVGAALGVAIQLALPGLVRDLLPVDVAVSLSPVAILSGLGVGVWVALAFALRPLVGVRNISPLQVLRTEVDESAKQPWYKDWRGLLVTTLIVASVVALAISRAGGLREGLAISAAISVVLILLLGERITADAGRPQIAARGLAVCHASGCGESLSPVQPDALRRALTRLRRIPRQHAVSAADDAPHALHRSTRRPVAATCCSTMCRPIRARGWTRSSRNPGTS